MFTMIHASLLFLLQSDIQSLTEVADTKLLDKDRRPSVCLILVVECAKITIFSGNKIAVLYL